MNDILNKIEDLLKNEDLTKEESMKLIDQYCYILERTDITLEFKEDLINQIERYRKEDEDKSEKCITHKKSTEFIKNVGDFFELNSCIVKYTGRDTTFKFGDKEIVFDLKVEDTVGRECFVIDTETERIEREYFTKKIKQYLEFVRHSSFKKIYLIAPNHAILGQIEESIYLWVKRHETLKVINNKSLRNNAVIVFVTTTLTDLQLGKVQETYIGVK